jgi:hypothetical protein
MEPLKDWMNPMQKQVNLATIDVSLWSKICGMDVDAIGLWCLWLEMVGDLWEENDQWTVYDCVL